MKKSTMLLALITCILCIIGGYVFGNSRASHDVTIFTDSKDTITTRDYTVDIDTAPTENVFGNGSHITIQFKGTTTTEGIKNE